MVEGKARFPEFEKYLERGGFSVYHEDSLLDYRSFTGILITIIGVFFVIFTSPYNSDYVVLAILPSIFGFLLVIVSILMNKSNQHLYRYQGFSRHRISEAIMFIDSQLAQTKKSESTVPYHDNAPFSNYELISKRENFILFLKDTRGLITWPAELIIPIEKSLQNNQKHLSSFIATLVTIFVILVLATYFLLMSGFYWLVVVGVLLLVFCTIECPIASVIYMVKNKHVFKGEWIVDVRRSEFIQLEDSLKEIFSLLSSQFPYPLRFFLVHEYPQLEYTGRMKTTKSNVQLREAVLYPADTTDSRMY
jgi:ABC-type multidrug transport system fused ATPase/permease subunit